MQGHLTNSAEYRLRLSCFILIVVLIGSLLAGISWHFYQRNVYWAVYLDGDLVGYTHNTQWLQNSLQQFQKSLQGDDLLEIIMNEELQMKKLSSLTSPPETAPERLLRSVKKRSTFAAYAVSIQVEGESIALVSNSDLAQKIVHEVKTEQVDALNSQTNTEVQSVEIVEDITFTAEPADPDKIISFKQAKNILLRGTDEVVRHEVQQGETAWGIASAAGMSVQQLKKANSDQGNLSSLQPGDTLKVVEAEPQVTINTVEKTTYTRRIPFEVKTRQDDSRWPWETKVQQAGRPGLLEVQARVYRENGVEIRHEVFSEKRVRDPVTHIVIEGTKTVPEHGTGQFILPAEGRLTSGFGPRARGFHTGIDLAMSVGTPVSASDSGIVTAAGWAGAYGNRIKIDHGQGEYVTLYAHLSQIAVNVGEVVEQGEIVGYSGNTGRSTGPHLHFEIWVNGEPRDPIKFFTD